MPEGLRCPLPGPAERWGDSQTPGPPQTPGPRSPTLGSGHLHAQWAPDVSPGLLQGGEGLRRGGAGGPTLTEEARQPWELWSPCRHPGHCSKAQPGLSPNPHGEWSPASGHHSPQLKAERCPQPQPCTARSPQGPPAHKAAALPLTCPGPGAAWGVTIRAPPPAPLQQAVLPDARTHSPEHGPQPSLPRWGTPPPPSLRPQCWPP